MKSRLNRKLEKQKIKQTILFLLGTIFILFLIGKFGISIITTGGDITSNFKKNDTSKASTTSEVFLKAPILNNIPDGSDKSKLSINGKSFETDGNIEVYVNDKLEDEIKISDKSDFQSEINLAEGENIIRARFSKNNKNSDYSKEFIVYYIKGEPKLEVTSPSDNTYFNKDDKKATIQGKTDPTNTIEINGFTAIVDAQGNFTYDISLKDGQNTINIDAINQAKKKTTKTLNLFYNP